MLVLYFGNLMQDSRLASESSKMNAHLLPLRSFHDAAADSGK